MKIDYNKKLSPVIEDIGCKSIIWENYPSDSETGREWKVTEVLFNQMEWLSEALQEYNNDEFEETIENIQKILQALSDSEETDYNIT